MTELAYPPARSASFRVHSHLSRHIATLRANGETDLACLPDPATIEALIEAAFWASLRREEGYTPTISLSYVSPEQAGVPMRFGRGIPLGAAALTRMAPAVERPGIHLGVYPIGGDLMVWGATRKLPPYSLVLEVIAPGLLVVKHSRAREAGKFVNVAVLQGDEIKVVEQSAALLPDCPALLTSLLGLDARSITEESANILIELAVSMRAHKKGGALLVVPSNSALWRESVIHPITYAVDPPYTGLSKLLRRNPAPEPSRGWEDALRKAVDGIAGLTAVDGATIISDTYELLAFGAKIVRRAGHPQVSQVISTEPIEGAEPLVVDAVQLGGTRHLSAAQFVQDQRDSVALVASQDGRFTVVAWSPCEEKVHAHRIESLLL